MTVVAETFVFRGSSNLATAAYDPESRELTIEFQSGDEYKYTGVDSGTYRGLTLAGSAGQYFARNIKGRFPYDQV
jgi:hypothetical protein